LTAYARREDAAEALSAGFQLHVSKPVNQAVFLSAVAALAAPPRADGDALTERTA
jgi:CheY-like chemotaxis protein